MPYGQTRTDEVEAAVIALLTAGLSAAGVTDIAALTTDDLDEDDDIIVQPPAVRIAFADEDFAPSEDREYLSYRSNQEHIALVGANRPSTVQVERGAAQNILELTKNVLAGARIALSSNPDGAIISLHRAALFQMKRDGTWYAIRFCVESFSVFAANIGSIR